MDLIRYLENDLITDNTKEFSPSKIFLKTSQNAKYAKQIKNFITPEELLKSLNLKTKFIGITGTNGKTTTAFVLTHLLENFGYSVATQGTEGFFVNGEKKEGKTLTTPSIFTTIKRTFKYNPDFFIMEVSSHAIAQNRIEGIDFFIKKMTSFSQDHLDYHKTMEEYKKIKESFFKDEVVKILKGRIVSKNKVEIDGYVFEMNPKNLYILEEPLVEDINMAGEFNKYNFSLALKAAELITNKNLIELKENLKTFRGVAGRMEIISKNPLVIVDFAHTPDGMEKVLSAVNNRKIAVFGAGGNRDKGKRVLMGEVADKYADYIILTEDNPRCEKALDICKQIARGIKRIPYEIVTDRKKAIKKAIELAKKKNATLMILGKGDENYIEYCGKKIDYSDKAVVLSLLK